MKITNKEEDTSLVVQKRHGPIQLFSHSLPEDSSCLFSKRAKTYEQLIRKFRPTFI